MTGTSDVRTRDDVIRMVDAFYARVRSDSRLGPVFDEVARVDWDAHLPKMYAFWEGALFGTPGFRGEPLAVHAALARRVPLGPDDFGRWLELFAETVDALFAGPVATSAKRRAERIADVMLERITAGAAGGGRRLI
ncbi:MAG: group III truncated hemoglobin [Vicinamibacterales bacterium]